MSAFLICYGWGSETQMYMQKHFWRETLYLLERLNCNSTNYRLELNNTLLSNDILAVDYPVEKISCYVSDDDGGALLTFEGHEIAETICVECGAATLLQLKSLIPNCPPTYCNSKKPNPTPLHHINHIRCRKTRFSRNDQFRYILKNIKTKLIFFKNHCTKLNINPKNRNL